MNVVVINLVSTGTVVAITAAVNGFRRRFPRHKVETEDYDTAPDDGDFIH